MSLSKLKKLLKEKNMSGVEGGNSTKHFLDTGFPPLNEALTGEPNKGFPSGQIVMIAGPSGCGKTAILCEMFISAQKVGGFAGMMDGETQFAHELALERGLSQGDDWDYWKPDTFEEAVGTAITTARLIRENDLIPKDAPIVFGFDSIHSLTPQSKYDNLMDAKKGAIEKGEKLSMHDNYALAKFTSDWFPVIQREFDKYGVTGIFLNQVRVKTTAQGATYFTYPGGDAPYYYSSTVLVMQATKVYDEKTKDFLRNEIRCTIEKSRNTVPYSKVKWDYVRVGEKAMKFDIIGSYAKHLQSIGAIETKGPRVGWKGKSPYLSGVIAELNALPESDAKAELVAIHEAFKADGTITYPYPTKD
jgi:RecA/RadA recombinase